MNDCPRKLSINWPAFMWRKMKHWLFSESALFALFVAFVWVAKGGVAGLAGVIVAIIGFISICAWYFPFVRVWEKAYTRDRIHMVAEYDRSRKPVEMAGYVNKPIVSLDEWGEFFTARKPGVYWILIDDDIRTGSRTPGPLLIALFALLWFLVWFLAMAVAWKNIDEEIDTIYTLTASMFIPIACGMMMIVINPRLARPGVQ